MKKKLLTGLLISTTLNGVINPVIFAASDLNESSNTISFTQERSFSKLTLSGWIPTPGPTTTGYFQKFTRTGFQPYIYKGAWLYDYHGFISDYTDTTFTVLTNFFTINGKLYHSDSYGNSTTGFATIDGDLYYFNNNLSDPYAYKGWATIGDNRYYFNSDYKAEKGLTLIDGKVYFFDDEGHLETGIQEIDGKTYYFDANGKQVTGWYSFNNEYRFYFDPLNGGAAHEGWYDKDTTGIMHFNDRGVMSKGVTKVNDDYYVFLTNGSGKNAYRATGWYTDTSTNKRYYFDPQNDGKAIKGWYSESSSKVLYFHEDGSMAKGVTKVNDDYYVFLTNGSGKNAYKTTGWYTDTSTNKRYYFDPQNDGKAVKGTKVIDGKTYTFSSEGVLQN